MTIRPRAPADSPKGDRHASREPATHRGNATAHQSAGSALRGPLLIAAAGLLLFLLPLVALSGQDRLLLLDAEATTVGRELAAAGFRAIAEVVTAFGSLPATAAAVIVATIALAVARRPRAAIGLAVAFVAVVISVNLIKAGVGRLRPPGPSPSLTTASFPSGHAANSTAYTALAVALLAGRSTGAAKRRALIAGALALTLVIGLTRVVLGVHYLSDVVAGWALAAAIYGLSAAAVVAIGRIRQNE